MKNEKNKNKSRIKRATFKKEIKVDPKMQLDFFLLKFKIQIQIQHKDLLVSIYNGCAICQLYTINRWIQCKKLLFVAPWSTQPFILLRLIKWLPGLPGGLVVKSKLPPCRCCSLEAGKGTLMQIWKSPYMFVFK